MDGLSVRTGGRTALTSCTIWLIIAESGLKYSSSSLASSTVWTQMLLSVPVAQKQVSYSLVVQTMLKHASVWLSRLKYNYSVCLQLFKSIPQLHSDYLRALSKSLKHIHIMGLPHSAWGLQSPEQELKTTADVLDTSSPLVPLLSFPAEAVNTEQMSLDADDLKPSQSHPKHQLRVTGSLLWYMEHPGIFLGGTTNRSSVSKVV